MGKNNVVKKPFDLESYQKRMRPYLEGSPKANLFWKALDFATRAHDNQWRRSGDAYILHPCSVAEVLAAELDVHNPEILAAALLHDTIEDVDEITAEVIRREFGRNVETIVEGCTKVTHYSGNRQNFTKMVHRKIFSGAAAKLEVILVKLADRIHNLRTLNSMPAHKRQRIATETMDVYAPLATLLGLFDLKRDLYSRALEYKFPQQSRKLKTHIRNIEQDPLTQKVVENLSRALEAAGGGVTAGVSTKGLWAYYDIKNRILIKEIDNAQEIHLACADTPSCYQTLGVLNQLYPPIPRTIRDFIANPKPTGYQALHARANINGRKYLFKIRTKDMARCGQRGTVRDWGDSEKVRSRFEHELQEMFDIIGNDASISFRDLIIAKGRKEMYTYTPRGDLICLPVNSLVLDFAFRVHTDIGHTCVGAVVNQTEVDPGHRLRDGDVVKIIRQADPVRFAPEMQEQCQTAKARHELAKADRQRRDLLAQMIGRSVLEQEMRRYGLPLSLLEKEGIRALLDYFNIAGLDELHNRVGTGAIRLRELIHEIKDCIYAGEALAEPTGQFNVISLNTLDPAAVKLSACCRPNPTERGMMGLLSERGLSMHHHDCAQLAKIQLQREDAVEVLWLLKETRVRKVQRLFFPEGSQSHLFRCLTSAPKEMQMLEVTQLSSLLPTPTPAWQVDFRVDNLQDLRDVLRYLTRSTLPFNFKLEQ